MKKILTLTAVAFLAAGVGAERADADTPLQNAPILTSIGEFNIGLLSDTNVDHTPFTLPDTSVISNSNTGDVTDTFDMVRGSYNDVAPASAFDTLGNLIGAWSADANAAFRYAIAFANAIVDTSVVDIYSQVPFFPIFPGTTDFTSITYAFAYGLAVEDDPFGNPNPATASVNAYTVTYDGTSATPMVADTLVAFDTPQLGDSSTIDGTGSPENASAIWWATAPDTFNNPPVPEIDGPVLVQVGFALMGLYVLMLGRRRREDEVGMGQAA